MTIASEELNHPVIVAYLPELANDCEALGVSINAICKQRIATELNGD